MFTPDRLEGNKGESQEVAPQAPPTELELRAREQELKNRYEGPRRNVEAQQLKNERNVLRDKENKRIKELKEQLSKTVEWNKSDTEYIENNKQQKVGSHLGRLSELDRTKAEIQEKQLQRGLFQKLKNRLFQDPLQEKIDQITKMQEQEQFEIDVISNETETKVAKANEVLQNEVETNSRLAEIYKNSYIESKKALLEKTRERNKASREAIRDTFLSLERGELDISQLARQENAVVVHAIPLDGWSMRNTSMNNEEVDIESLSAKEKSDILLTTRPDVSASILSVNTIQGQDMFYPFGYILEGKIIASYEGDEGTKAAGNARRRKEEFHGTLQKGTKEQFAKIARSESSKRTSSLQYNESIVHQPNLKGILIDENVLANRPDLGDNVVETFPLEKKEEIIAKYGNKITSTGEGIPTKGSFAGKEIIRIHRDRNAIQKAIEYGVEHHPELPIYLRKADGIYSLAGKKVSAEDIYGK